MLTADDIRRCALALPEAYEEPHFHMASFRVAKRIFCTLHDPEPRIMLKLDPEDQANLADGEAIVAVPGSWGRKGSTFVWYRELDPERLPGLMRVAWARVAPKRLLR
ncbi:MAG TPA: MmcQ/YjbR family DNA-binding protein [Phenylobacterium sp.]|uniref:MmcQ/YjbR family DNA-binding protein n=1 Tax=Phenylobacterium sp. TaxID=1871053 RepID=UPI002CF6F5D6|nr:MmcQ/YjbR family DNA-binding protein [Phenylobacterium sp.]HSV02170.1 MmcQ/YjbR family DNA-binding protein [Phenylobacterium sp.]